MALDYSAKYRVRENYFDVRKVNCTIYGADSCEQLSFSEHPENPKQTAPFKVRYTQSFLDLRKGQKVDERYLGIFLRNNRRLWVNYCRRCNEPAEASYLGMDENYYPDSRKVMAQFLEDLVETGVIEKIDTKNKKGGRKK